MKIKVKEITEGCKFEIIKNGDWIDLKSAEDVHFDAPKVGKLIGRGDRDVLFDFKYIKLGIAMALPSGYEAELKGRSSLTRKFGIDMKCSGVMDNSYRGNNDEWLFYAMGLRDTTIHKGDRICQFRVQLNQKATIWQKIKWLFSNKIKFEWVNELEDKDRGGFGSTGVK